MGSGEIMPQQPEGFIPDSIAPEGFIPDSVQEQVPNPSGNLLTGAWNAAKRIVNYDAAAEAKARGERPIYGEPSSQSILPEIRQPETWMGGFGKGLYDEFVRPLASPMGFASMMVPGHSSAVTPKLLSAAEELPIRIPRQLSAGPRFIAGEAGIAENRPYTIDIGPITPRIGQREVGTILPRETEGLVNIPPELAAERGIQFGKPKVIGGRYQGIDYPIGKATLVRARDLLGLHQKN